MSIEFSTCDFCDQFRDANDDALRVIPPGFNDYGAHRRFCGPVVTVRCYDDNTLVKDLVSSPGQGRVLVVDGGGLFASRIARWQFSCGSSHKRLGWRGGRWLRS